MADVEKRKILFYGDSNTWGYDPADMYENRYPEENCWTYILQEKLGNAWEVDARGMNGRTLPNLRYEGERIEKMIVSLSGGDIFAVMLGTNDILSSMKPDGDAAVGRMRELISFLIMKKIRPQDILVIAPVPVLGRAADIPEYRAFYEENIRMNEGFRTVAEDQKTMFADAGAWGIGLTYDQVHFSARGHRTFAEKMYEFLSRQYKSATEN